MKKNLFLILGAFSGAIAVALGAFAAHHLRSSLSPGLFSAFETATRYQMYHALALLLTGIILRQQPGRPSLAAAAGWAFVAGTVFFSGSLYALSLTDTPAFGAITPIGGLAFIAGWILLGISLIARSSP